MDLLAPTDPIERMLRRSGVIQRLQDPVTQSLCLACVGLVSFCFMGVSFLFPQFYTRLSVLHIMLRAVLCLALTAFIYHQWLAKRTARAEAAVTKQNVSEEVVQSVTPRPQALDSHPELSGSTASHVELPIPDHHKPHNLLFGALQRDRMVEGVWAFVHRSFFAPQSPPNSPAAASAATPVAVESKYPEVLAVFQVGDLVCGHKNLIHGGLTAAMVDQTLGMATFVAQPKSMCFTANLNINYRKPVPAHSVVAVRAVTSRIEGRKIHATARVELLSDRSVLFADATALFISPK